MIEKEMLNEQQSEFVDKIISHITNAVETNPDSYKDRFIFLQGLSGSGKSTSSAVIIKELSKVSVRGKPLTIKVTAPTHKALGVLREMVESIGLRNIPVSTIHSHLGLKLTENYKNGTMELQKDQSKTVERFDAIVVDECFRGDTEVLTDKGFVRFDSLTKEELIASVNSETKEISFKEPLRYIEKPYRGNMVSFKSDKLIDLDVTENHDMLINSKKIKAKDVTLSPRNKIFTAGFGVGDGSDELTTEEKFAIAFQADGTLKNVYNVTDISKKSCLNQWGFEPKENHGNINFLFEKQRKIDLFKKDFKDLNIDERIYKSRPKATVFVVKNYDVTKISKNLFEVFDITKISYKKAVNILEYISLWDGFKHGKDGIGYSNTNKDSVNFVQIVSILANRRCSISTIEDNRKETYKTCYKAHSSNKPYITTQRIKKGIYEYDGKVYCVTVPDGNIIVRQNNRVVITGNCSMVSDALFEYIIEAVDMGKVKAILFIGDTAQLRPVESNPAPISEPINDFCESLTLTKVVRQAEGNPLIQMANSIRAYIQDNMDNNLGYPSFKTVIDIIKEHTDNEHIIGFNSEAEFREHYEANPKAEFESLSLAYTNKKVDTLNTNARNFFKGKGTPYLMEGDTVVFMESYEENGLPLFQNNEVVKLQQVLKAYDDLLDIWYWDCLDREGRYFRVVDKRSLPDYEYHLSELAKEAKKAPSDERKGKWITYFETKKRFASIAYHYGSTITKSQGSSVKDVYIDLSELDYFSKKQGDLDLIYRLCYVATTRCKERLIYKI